MPFFQNSVLPRYLKNQDKQRLKEAFEKFSKHFKNPEIQENIRNAKEEQYQEGFLNDLFVNVLGYIKNPNSKYNLTTEYKNVKDSKKADGAIIIDNKVKAVIELKGTDTTDLSKVEGQAFGYKNNQAGCVYVITSNFEKLRFYIDNAIEHLEFNLFSLNENDFELLYLCLAFENIEKDIPKKLKDDSVSNEDNITKKLYKDYSIFKQSLFQNLVELNPGFDQVELFKKSQKLLDRFLFLFFAEDRDLLPPNSVKLILNQWNQLKELDEHIPLYDRFKKYFGYLNTGFKGKQYDVFAYNGGLFKPDETLDSIQINDEILYEHTLRLSEYDFASEVDVNILGHIFENSLNELEEIKAQLEGYVIDKTKTKRKRDGVFYTPKYITKYIVDSTVGKLCEEKKQEFEIKEEDYVSDRKRTKPFKQTLYNKLLKYREWLLQITICDPACGSGAFLNQALDFLINEHRYIDELQAKLFGDAMVLTDVEKSILENNLFGVDINEESVEIAKLSLWLRTAQPNRKLNDLSNNIKCGNSLIDDPKVAGDKAFNWYDEFPTVFPKHDEKIWHVTFALHNSRYADKLSFGVFRKKPVGYIAPTYPYWSESEQEILIDELSNSAIEQDLNIIECMVCSDHVHSIIICNKKDLETVVGNWKGRTAFTYNRRINPKIDDQKARYNDGTKEKLWSKGFNEKEITDIEQLESTSNYIRNNRLKHKLAPLSDKSMQKLRLMQTNSAQAEIILRNAGKIEGYIEYMPNQQNHGGGGSSSQPTDELARQLFYPESSSSNPSGTIDDMPNQQNHGGGGSSSQPTDGLTRRLIKTDESHIQPTDGLARQLFYPESSSSNPSGTIDDRPNQQNHGGGGSSSQPTDGLTRRLIKTDESHIQPTDGLARRLFYPESSSSNPSSTIDDMPNQQNHGGDGSSSQPTDGLTRRLIQKHGFDCIIGNPPYVQLQSLGDMSDKLKNCGYKTYDKGADLYCLFTERGYQLLKDGGIQSFIMPNKWMLVEYGKPLRKFLSKTGLLQVLNFGDIQFFQEAATIVCIFVTQKGEPKKNIQVLSLNQKTYNGDFMTEVKANLYDYENSRFGENEWSIQPLNDSIKLDRMKLKGIELKNLPISINYGIKTGFNEAFLIDEETRKILIEADHKSAELIKPMLRGRDIMPYGITGFEYLINVHNGIKEKKPEILPIIIDDYPALKKHLDAFLPSLEKRGDKGNTPYNLRNCAYLEDFAKPKILYPNMTSVFPFTYDESGLMGNDKTFILTSNDESVSLLFLTAVFNSSLAKLWIWYNCPELLGGTREIRKVYFEHFPVPIANKDQKEMLEQQAKERSNFTSNIQTLISKFIRNIQREFNLEKLSTKLENWFQLTYNEFLKELVKSKAKLTLSQKAEWEDYFNNESKKVIEIKHQIETTDKKIDHMVYELYGLMEGEIQIVEKQ